jgi:hypothetical protein
MTHAWPEPDEPRHAAAEPEHRHPTGSHHHPQGSYSRPLHAGYGPAGHQQSGYPQAAHGQPPTYAQPGAYAPAAYSQPRPAQPATGYRTAPGGPSRSPGPHECRLCGSAPAVDVTFRGHQGMIVIMRFLHTKGPFCRDCGLATFRSMTGKTLWQGWWGYLSLLIAPITVLINLGRRSSVAHLAAPARDPAVIAPLPAPLDPGAPLHRRPEILGLLIPVALVVLFLIAIVASAVNSAPA